MMSEFLLLEHFKFNFNKFLKNKNSGKNHDFFKFMTKMLKIDL